MPITFSFHREQGYVVVVYSGRFGDMEMLNAWKKLYEDKEWVPGLNEIVDCSQVDGTDVTSDGLEHLAEYTNGVFSKHGIHSVKVAIYAPTNLPFGMSRIYQSKACELSEKVRVFRSMHEAISWIRGVTEK